MSALGVCIERLDLHLALVYSRASTTSERRIGGTVAYIVEPVLAELRAALVERVRSGELIRRGGLLVIAPGRPGGGQIAAHLRDVTKALPPAFANPPPPSLPGALHLSQVAAAASVLNLGVSIAGFAILAHKIGRLQSSVNELAALTQSNHVNLLAGLGRLSQQLVELRYIALDSRELLAATLDEVRLVRQDLLDSYLARVLTEADLLQSAQRLADHQVYGALRTFGETRRWLEQAITLHPARPRDDTHWFERLLRYRVWCLTGACETQLLRRVGEDERAAAFARSLATTSRTWASSWRDALMPRDEFCGAFRFAHSSFSQLPREVYLRLVRLHDGTILTGTDARELEGRMAVGREMPALGSEWVERQVALAALLDFAEEATARLESAADELTMCLAEGFRYEDWEALSAPVDSGDLAVIEVRG